MFLTKSPIDSIRDVAARPLISSDTQRPSADATPAATTPISDSQTLKIVPKGLRSFDYRDADFFLELLPGACNRDGISESVGFWKSRIEERNADQTFAVGMVYGPSGIRNRNPIAETLIVSLSWHRIRANFAPQDSASFMSTWGCGISVLHLAELRSSNLQASASRRQASTISTRLCLAASFQTEAGFTASSSVDITKLALSVFHKLVQINDAIDSGRFDCASTFDALGPDG